MTALRWISFFLLSLLSSFPPASADDASDAAFKAYDDALWKVITPLPDFTYGIEGLREGAHCIRRKRYTNDEILAWLDSYAASTQLRASMEVNGVRLRDESPKLIDLLHALTTNRDYRKEERNEHQRTFDVPCDKAICASREIFGPEVGPRLLFLLGRFGFNGSPFVNLSSGRAADWTASELDDILLALSDFPPSILPRWREQPMIHDQRGNEFCRGYAGGWIKFCDLWTELGPSEKRVLVVSHEVGHKLAETLLDDLDRSVEWLKLGGWGEDPRYSSGLTHPESVATKYAAISNYEDFAEAVVLYRYRPELLLSKSRAKYEFLRELVFDGVEYRSEAQCSRPKPLSATFAANGMRALPKGRPTRAALEIASKACGTILTQSLDTGDLAEAEDPLFAECVSRAISRSAAQEAAVKAKWGYPELAMGSLWKRVYPLAPNPVTRTIARDVRDGYLRALERIAADHRPTTGESCDSWSQEAVLATEPLYRDFHESVYSARPYPTEYSMTGFYFLYSDSLAGALKRSCESESFARIVGR